MYKIFLLSVCALAFSNTAKADTILVLDDNNNVKQQIYTAPNTYQVSNQTTTVVPQNTQQIVVTGQTLPPPVVVVRQTPMPRNYHYDHLATTALVGFSGAIVGNALFNKHHHHHRPKHHRPRPPRHHRR